MADSFLRSSFAVAIFFFGPCQLLHCLGGLAIYTSLAQLALGRLPEQIAPEAASSPKRYIRFLTQNYRQILQSPLAQEGGIALANAFSRSSFAVRNFFFWPLSAPSLSWWLGHVWLMGPVGAWKAPRTDCSRGSCQPKAPYKLLNTELSPNFKKPFWPSWRWEGSKKRLIQSELPAQSSI